MSADEFFVGYLSTPSRLRRDLRIVAVLIGIMACAGGVLLASFQRDPGDGTWQLDQPIEVTGVVRASPYPLLETDGSQLLVVSEGKAGAFDRLRELDGQNVRLKATLLSRKPLSMLELSSDSGAVQKNVQNTLTRQATSASNLRTVTLVGEIVDSKCFFGAMKPGDAKTHKACAALCIKGGIPPMFVSFDPTGNRTEYLLVNEAGGAINGDALEAVLPFVADRVELTGASEERGGLNCLRISSIGAIRRL